MDEGVVIERLEAIAAALRKGRPKPQKWYAFLLPVQRPAEGHAYLAAALSLDFDGEPERVAETVRRRFEAIGAAAGGIPTSTQWVHAAMTQRFGVDAARYVRCLKAPKLNRDAALTLTALGVDGAELRLPVQTIYKAISPFFVDQSDGFGARLSVYSAAHAAAGRTPEQVLEIQAAAEAVFETDKDAKKASAAGARACAVFDADPLDALQRFKILLAARKRKADARKIKRDALMEWAALGMHEADFDRLSRLLSAASKLRRLTAQDRIRIAEIAYWVASPPSMPQALRRLAIPAGGLAAATALAPDSSGGGGDAGGGG